MLHLAAHSVKNRVLFEEKAFSDGYVKKDVNGFVPEGNTISSENYEDADDRKSLKPFIDFDFLIEDVTEKCGLDGEKFGGLTVGKSQEPGRFVFFLIFFFAFFNDCNLDQLAVICITYPSVNDRSIHFLFIFHLLSEFIFYFEAEHFLKIFTEENVQKKQ